MAEAPRLWYLKFREVLIAEGLTELKAFPAVFIKGDLAGDEMDVAEIVKKRVDLIVFLHVDDGLVLGEDEAVDDITKKLNNAFPVKWQPLEKGQKEPVKYLGVEISRDRNELARD